MNRGTATMTKLFMEVYISWMTMVRGISPIVISTITEAAPKEMAMGTPKAIKPRKIISSATLISFRLQSQLCEDTPKSSGWFQSRPTRRTGAHKS